jgi:hypothetical protein
MANLLLQWQYLIYLLPLAISALLLLLSSLRLGHRGGQGHGIRLHAPAGGHGHSGMQGHGGLGRFGHHGQGGAAHGPRLHHAPAVRARVGKVEVQRHGENKENLTVSTNLMLQITGADRAPLAMIIEAFCLVWGVVGYWANQYTVQAANPTFRQMLPSLGIALGGGIIGARIAAEIIARVMPQDESQDVSRDGLFGLTGRIAFPVSDSAGRIHVHDEHGTLHDETCRVAPGHGCIPKGHKALVIDMDAQGRLIVEEVPDTVH